MTSTPNGRTRLDYEDIRSGMALMQTVYTIALVLGLEKVVEASYSLYFSRTSEPSVTSPGYLVVILAAIILLSIRFFWVPRNLNSYIISFYDQLKERVFTRMTTIHFPIALAHALLFYYISQVFVDMTQVHAGIESKEMTDNATRFVVLYASLLLLNSAWLLRITPRAAKATQPGKIWAVNNAACALLALIELALFRAVDLSNAAFIVLACGTFITNSVLDLWKASKFYILYEG
jgi:hypothetical protein